MKKDNPEKKETKEELETELKVEEPQESDTLTKQDEIELLKQKVTDLEAEVGDWKDKLLRAHADLDNTRKRLVKEKEEAIKYANSKLIEDLLMPMDNLERAMNSCTQATDVKAIADGVSMVYQQFADTFKRNGLEPIISAPGTEFNPEEHEACMMDTSADVKVETVDSEFVKGYKLHGRVLRPSKVKVIKPEI